MKDMYSFDISKENALITYQHVLNAYRRLFTKLELDFVVADADSGNIGGDISHEIQIVSNIGEDFVLRCDSCDYAANVEKARGKIMDNSSHSVESHSIRSIEDLLKEDNLSHLSMEAGLVVYYEFKTVSNKEQKIGVVLVPKGRNPNELKVKTFLQKKTGSDINDVRVLPLQDPACKELMESNKMSTVFVDDAVLQGAESWQKTLGNIAGELSLEWGDFRTAHEKDGCLEPNCHGSLKVSKGIEVGHVFYLGTKYSSKLDARIKHEQQEST